MRSVYSPVVVDISSSHSSKITRLRISNLCCTGESRIIKNTLAILPGIEDVSINIIGRYAVIKHCPNECCTSAVSMVDKLNEKKLGASIQEASDAAEEDEKEEERDGERDVLLIALAVFFILGAFSQMAETSSQVYNSFYLICTGIGSIPIAYDVYVAWLRRTVDINVLMFMAICGAVVASEFFDAVIVVILFALTSLIEDEVLRWVRKTVKVSKGGMPKKALLATGKSVPLDSLEIGDIVAYRAGEMISIDGKVIKGQAVVDESAMTGEAIPISKETGSTALSGTVMQDGYIEVEVTELAKNSIVRKLQDTIADIQVSL